MRYLNKEQIKANIAYDKLLKAKKICAACGTSLKGKKAKNRDDLCKDCLDALD